MAFNKRVMYRYKACSKLKCFVLSKANWFNLSFDHPYFSECLKFNFITFYNEALRKPLVKKKDIDRKKFDRRNDYK